MGKVRAAKHVRSANSVTSTAPLPAFGAAQRRKAAMAGSDVGLLSSPSHALLHDVWAPERAAGAAGDGHGALGIGGGAAASPSLASAQRLGGARGAIPGMSLLTVSGAALDPSEAPEAMDLDAENASAAAISTARSAAAAEAEEDKPARPPTKLARRKAKKEAFVAKLTGLRDSKAKHADVAKRRANPPVLVGDVTGLQAELEGIAREAASRPQKAAKVPVPAGMTPKGARALKAQVDEKVKRTVSKKGRRAALAAEMAAFKSTLAHPQFRASPAATIAEHLKNAMLAEKAAIVGLAAAGTCGQPIVLNITTSHRFFLHPILIRV